MKPSRQTWVTTLYPTCQSTSVQTLYECLFYYFKFGFFLVFTYENNF